MDHSALPFQASIVLASALLAYLHGILFAWLDGNIGHHLRRGIFAQLLSVNFGN